MKLHDLRPADGSRQPRTRVGRGIAAGKGKTAGRGTKGQKARAGGSIPPWFEGGQTPLHMRIPKLRGFKNRFKIEYEVVNIGAIGSLAERGAFEAEAAAKKAAKAAPITVNQDILRAVGLVRTLNKPLKILGAGELSVALFVVADAFTASARAKIEAAGGSVNVARDPHREPAGDRTGWGRRPDGAGAPNGGRTCRGRQAGRCPRRPGRGRGRGRRGGRRSRDRQGGQGIQGDRRTQGPQGVAGRRAGRRQTAPPKLVTPPRQPRSPKPANPDRPRSTAAETCRRPPAEATAAEPDAPDADA